MARRRVRIRDNNNIPEVVSQMDKLNGRVIRVGVFGPGAEQYEKGANITIGHLAAIHEFGTRIPVTEKMRKYLVSQGLHLKKETEFIIIPERPFIRAGWDEYEKQVMDKADRLIKDAIQNGVDIDTILDEIGQEASGKIQLYARDLQNPENHPFTITRKDSSNPLVDDGQLVQAIDYEVL